jgi:hypothetical protein
MTAEQPPADTIATLVARALAGYEGLVRLGEEVEDEWTYVSDLSAAWRARLEAEAAARGSEEARPEMAVAVDLAADEAALITDPHRAIDWLSTFPQVVLIALGARP